MVVSAESITYVGALADALFLLRRWQSSKWGVFTSNAKLNGKVIIVTGGNAGLGEEVSLDLAKGRVQRRSDFYHSGGGKRGSIITFYFFIFFVPNVLKIISRHYTLKFFQV